MSPGSTQCKKPRTIFFFFLISVSLQILPACCVHTLLENKQQKVKISLLPWNSTGSRTPAEFHTLTLCKFRSFQLTLFTSMVVIFYSHPHPEESLRTIQSSSVNKGPSPMLAFHSLSFPSSIMLFNFLSAKQIFGLTKQFSPRLCHFSREGFQGTCLHPLAQKYKCTLLNITSVLCLHCEWDRNYIKRVQSANPEHTDYCILKPPLCRHSQ